MGYRWYRFGEFSIFFIFQSRSNIDSYAEDEFSSSERERGLWPAVCGLVLRGEAMYL